MNKVIASTLGSVLALSLVTAAFAASPIKNLAAWSSNGAAPVALFSTNGFGSTNGTKSEVITEYIKNWALGPIGFDINGGNLKIMKVDAPKGLHVSLKDASGGANSDKLVFVVTADANTPKGSYPVRISLENSKFGDAGVVTITVNVQ